MVDLVVDKHAGMPHCFGADVLDQHTLTMTRSVVAAATAPQALHNIWQCMPGCFRLWTCLLQDSSIPCAGSHALWAHD